MTIRLARLALAALALLLPSAALAAPSTAVAVVSPAYQHGPLVKIGDLLLAALERDGVLVADAPALPPAAYRDCLGHVGQVRTACVRDVLEATFGGTPQVVLVLEQGARADTVALSCIGRGGARVHAARLSPTIALTEDPTFRAASRQARAEAGRCLAAARADALRSDAGSVPPLVGVWRQELAYDCADSGRTGDHSWTPREPLNELTVTTDGRFTATYKPEQSHVDYRGVWRANPDTGRLLLLFEGGTPAHMDLDGGYAIDGGAILRMSDMWLGSAEDAGCGATFVRSAGRRPSRGQ